MKPYKDSLMSFLDLPDAVLNNVCRHLAVGDALYVSGEKDHTHWFRSMTSSSSLMLVDRRLARLVSETPILTLHFRCSTRIYPRIILQLCRPIKVIWWEFPFFPDKKDVEMLVSWLSNYRWASHIRVLRIKTPGKCGWTMLAMDRVAQVLPRTIIIYDSGPDS